MSDSLRYSPWDSPGQNIGVGSLSLLQGIFPNPGMELGSPALQADSLPTELSGKPEIKTLAPWKKNYDQPIQHIQKQKH